MPRKTVGTTSSRKQKVTPPIETAAVQPAPSQVAPEVRSTEGRDNVTPINVAPIKPTAKKTQASAANLERANLEHVNLEEEIRRRAYELSVERKGAAGDPAADWFVAEREVRARYAGKAAFAATQGS